jgi:membrane-associated phospholipid phosphatase
MKTLSTTALRRISVAGIWASLIALVMVSPFDLALSIFYKNNAISSYSRFVNESLFDHGGFGLSDIVVFFLLGSLVAYFVSGFLLSRNSRWWVIRVYTGFIILTSTTMALSIVHAMKWALSRARPYDVLPNHLELYTPWFLPGRYTLAVGFNKGSFPSGHVATMTVLLLLFYLFARKPKLQVLAWITLPATLASCAVMGWYRAMVASHWVSDNIASVCIAFAVCHWFYFSLIQVDDQVANTRFRDLVAQKRVNWWVRNWEFSLTWLILLFVFSVAGVFVGFRLLLFESSYFGILASMGSALAGWFLWKVMLRLLRASRWRKFAGGGE